MSSELVSSGIEGVDFILKGGFPPNQLYLIEGPSGSGKTTFSLQFLLEGRDRGETVLFIGTSETEVEIDRIARSHNWSLEGVTVHHHNGQQLERISTQTVVYPVEVELPKTMEGLLSVVEATQPERVVIDSLTEIRLMASDEYWYWNQLLLLKNFFSKHRCTVLLTEIPTGEPYAAIHSIVHGKIELNQYIPGYGPDKRRIRVNKIQGIDYSSGYHDFRISTGGIVCFPRLIAAEHRQPFSPKIISCGNDKIDTFLGGGLDVGHSILFSGESGTGKSLFATQCAVAAARRNEKVAMYIFDERLHTLLQRSSGVGLDLNYYNEAGLITIQQVDPAELTPGEFSHRVKAEIDAGATMVILDSLNGYIYSMPEERFLTVHLHELSSFLNQSEVTTIFIAAEQHLLHNRSVTRFDVSYVADTVMQFFYNDYDGTRRKGLSVYKRRSGTHETDIRELIISENGITLGKPLSRKHNRKRSLGKGGTKG